MTGGRATVAWVGAVLAALTMACADAEAAAAPAKRAGTRRIVYFSQTEGYRHGDGIAAVLKVLKEVGAKDDLLAVDECTDYTKWTPEYLGQYDAMVSYGSGDLPLTAENKKALLDFIRDGKGFVAIHSASYMCPKTKWPEYTEMLNATFVNHPWSQKVRIIVEDQKHPATAHLGEAFEVQDEIYQFTAWSREKTHVLLTIDNNSVDVAKAGNVRPDHDYGIAWCHPYGKGRVFYTALGHGANVWNDERFQKHLLNGLLWTMGDLPGDAPLGTDGRPKK